MLSRPLINYDKKKNLGGQGYELYVLMAKKNCKIFCTLIFVKKRQKPASNDLDIIIWMPVPGGEDCKAGLQGYKGRVYK